MSRSLAASSVPSCFLGITGWRGRSLPCCSPWYRPDTAPVVVGPVAHGDPVWLGFCSACVSPRPAGLGHQGKTIAAEPRSYDLRPRVCAPRRLALCILQDPAVLSTEGPSPRPLRSPCDRYAPVAFSQRALDTLGHVTIQDGAPLLGPTDTAGVAPAADHWGHRSDQG